MKYSKQKLKIPILLSIFNLIAFIFVINYAYGGRDQNEAVLYIDSNCQFCEQTIEEVEFREYENHLDLNIKSLEGNSLNKRSFDLRSEECEISEAQKGVPLLYYQGKCFKGKLEILKELERLSIQN
jgi:hypothetical protein